VRDLSFALALLGLLVGCERSEPPEFVPECTPNAFRACQLDECRGVQQCADPGIWSECSCTVTDATFPESSVDAHGGDAQSDAASDASSDAQGDAADDADGS
jgi:hypothetical protein